MTGYTVHTGTNEKFAKGWDQIFGKTKEKNSDQAKPGKQGGQKSAGKKKQA